MRSCARGRGIDAYARDEMIYGAGYVVDGNAGYRTPRKAIGGRALDEIVRRAVRAETAILPDNPDGSRPDDSGRR
jgi:hypothetical protein